MTEVVKKFWETTWGQLRPGDEVKAPDGNVWTVHAAITSDGAGEWCLTHPDFGQIWTPHKECSAVFGRRPSLPAGDPGQEARAMELLANMLGATVVES